MAEVAKKRRRAPRCRGTTLSSDHSGYVHVSLCSAVTVRPGEAESALLLAGVQTLLRILLWFLRKEKFIFFFLLFFPHLFNVSPCFDLQLVSLHGSSVSPLWAAAWRALAEHCSAVEQDGTGKQFSLCRCN